MLESCEDSHRTERRAMKMEAYIVVGKGKRGGIFVDFNSHMLVVL